MSYEMRHFQEYEWLPPNIFKTYSLQDRTYLVGGIRKTFWQIIDPRIAQTADQMREFFQATITINNWHDGGAYTERGFRDVNSIGAPHSMHKIGCAFDGDIKGMSAHDVREQLLNHAALFPYLTRLEKWASAEDQKAGKEIKWVHCDIKELPLGISRIHEFVA